VPFSSLRDLLRRPFRRLEIPSSVPLPDSLAFLQRGPSISLVVFRGEIEAAVQEWLGRNGWRLIESAQLRASFEELSERSTHMRKTEDKTWEVVKTTYQVGGCTVLIDREMVVTTREAELAALCRATGCDAVIGGLWERVSRSLDIIEIGPTGTTHRSRWMAGARESEVEPWPQVTGGGPADIIEVFRGAGLPVDAIFGRDLPATVLLLAE
jgi:hypothetical protein